MRVLHIFNELKFSGAEIMYADAASIFKEKGCELTAMATGTNIGEYSTHFENAGYVVIHKPMPTIKNYFKRIGYYKNITKYLKENDYDVVHIHSSAARWGFALCTWLANVKSLYTFHNVFKSRKITYPYHYLLRWSAKVIFKCTFHTISDSVYDNELNYYFNKTNKIYNWYGDHRYYPSVVGEKLATRIELGIDEEALVLISVGGCSTVKRHTDIIKGLPIILKKHPNTLYLHLGKGSSENAERKLAQELGVSEHILFCGNVTNVRAYLIAADVYLMPSKFEGIPITTIETMATGIPCILYDVPGLRDFNKDAKTAILIEEDFTVLAQQVIDLYGDTKKIQAITQSALLNVTNLYNMKKNALDILKLYQ
jgi:glycosyltransferase involved in cell wall biosynthesis